MNSCPQSAAFKCIRKCLLFDTPPLYPLLTSSHQKQNEMITSPFETLTIICPISLPWLYTHVPTNIGSCHMCLFYAFKTYHFVTYMYTFLKFLTIFPLG